MLDGFIKLFVAENWSALKKLTLITFSDTNDRDVWGFCFLILTTDSRTTSKLLACWCVCNLETDKDSFWWFSLSHTDMELSAGSFQQSEQSSLEAHFSLRKQSPCYDSGFYTHWLRDHCQPSALPRKPQELQWQAILWKLCRWMEPKFLETTDLRPGHSHDLHVMLDQAGDTQLPLALLSAWQCSSKATTVIARVQNF